MSERRRTLPTADASGPALLSLARGNRAAAKERLRALAPAEIARACQELRPAVRDEFLMLLDHPEDVVPLLPEAELASTIRASGMSEAAWLLEMATPAQRVACIDLDCWTNYDLGRARLAEWIDALIEAGRPTLAAALEELDSELWVLALKQMTDIAIVSKEDEPPDGFFTEDGVVYFRPRSDEDFARVREIAHASLSEVRSRYWQLVYGVIFESEAECAEFALKWHNARMSDLGFPELEQAMQAYRPLRGEEVTLWEADLWQEGTPRDLVPAPDLPQQLRGTLVGRALAQLPPSRAADVLGYVLAVANAVAVADQLVLSDSESIPRALEKAVRGIDAGLQELARVRRQPPHAVLDVTRPLDLFRIGATLDETLRPERELLPDEEEPAEEDEG